MPNDLLPGSLTTLGFGGVAGAAVGFAAKKLTKLAALLLGVLFIVIQVLVSAGWVAVDWQAVQASSQQVWGDPGGVTLADRTWAIVAANLPFAGGFAAGFALGFKLG